jgi:hypothetical protein
MKEIQQSQSWPIDRDMATMSNEGQGTFAAEGQPRAGGGLKGKHKAAIALLQPTGRGTEVLLVQQANGCWWERVCNQLSDLRRCQRRRELAQGPAAPAENH